MPRTSSIDSAISSVSNTSLQKAGVEGREMTPTEIRNLIATAGGAESLVAHLLKDKKNVTTQNAQLWKLVEKQRTLLQGMNKDLERVTKERDKYKKKAKELQTQDEAGGKGHSQSPKKSTSTTDQRKAVPYGVDGATRKGDIGATASGITIEPSLFSNPARQDPVAVPAVHERSFMVESPTIPDLLANPIRVLDAKTSHKKLNISTAPGVVGTSLTTPTTPSTRMTPRKAKPAPLNLGTPKSPNALLSGRSLLATGRSEATFIEDEPERGRRRTREEDDKVRELSVMEADEARSRSKKEVLAKSTALQAVQSEDTPHPQPTEPAAGHGLMSPGLPLSPRPQHAALLNQGPTASSMGERMLAGSLMSPGLPMSPRPAHNQGQTQTLMNTLPMSPRAGANNLVLSPRAPKQPLPIPANPAAPVDPSLFAQHPATMPLAASPPPSEPDRLHVHEPSTTEPPTVYRGLVVSAYPNLLLPPNALPSVQVKVASSRLQPSRYSVAGVKVAEETTVFSLSVISRSSNSELWRLEKMPASLPHLELQLKAKVKHLPKMPDRKLFAGHSPSHLDARRKAIDDYFEELLDTHFDEEAAVMMCRFLSTGVLDPENQGRRSAAGTASPVPAGMGGPLNKSGYLTKKGKNFGGWKSRWFVLETQELKYYETAGGSHLGTIRLIGAKIGKQKHDESGQDSDGQYRHAFLVEEPKRKDATTFVRHVLCAESDPERDEWVRALVYHTDPNLIQEVRPQPVPVSNATSDYVNEKASVTSRDIMAAKDLHTNTPTPSSLGSGKASPGSEQQQRAHSATRHPISAPINGNIITDASSWGQKQPASANKDAKDKGTNKMSSIFSFKKAEPVTANQAPPKPRILRHNGYVRAVFGLPLAEAVEFCAPFNVEVDLPAVVYRSIEYLRNRDAAAEEGLFRVGGSNVVIKNLKERFNTEGDVDLVGEEEYHDVHAVASLLKTYLRELPSTLLTRDLHIEFVRVLDLTDVKEKVAAFNVLVHRLPNVNFMMLKTLSQYLVEVAQQTEKNKMSVRNMGIVFSPTLNIPTPVFTLFLMEYDAIFEADVDPSSPIRTTEIAAPPGLTPTDIRSPRQQMFGSLSTPAPNQTTFQGALGGPSLVSSKPQAGGLADMGFAPIQSSYESGNYVSIPQVQATPSPPAATQANEAGYGSLNGLLAPTNPGSERAKRRESAMLFKSVPY